MPQLKRQSLKLEARPTVVARDENEVDLLNKETELQTAILSATTRAYTKHDINTCDNCEEYSDDLMEKNGQWLCEGCREFED